MKKVAIVRIRGKVNVNKKIKDTLNMLRLYKKNTCIVIPNSPNYIGMLKKVKDHVTWGEINEETLKLLLERRGRLPKNKPLTENYLKEKLKLSLNDFSKAVFNSEKDLKDLPGLKLFFRLTPPIGGFERKGIKIPFSLGGVLGYRKDKINDLIKKML